MSKKTQKASDKLIVKFIDKSDSKEINDIFDFFKNIIKVKGFCDNRVKIIQVTVNKVTFESLAFLATLVVSPKNITVNTWFYTLCTPKYKNLMDHIVLNFQGSINDKLCDLFMQQEMTRFFLTKQFHSDDTHEFKPYVDSYINNLNNYFDWIENP